LSAASPVGCRSSESICHIVPGVDAAQQVLLKFSKYLYTAAMSTRLSGLMIVNRRFGFGDLNMKKVIAMLALVAATQASAFWGWNDWGNGSYGNGYSNGYADGLGHADAAADFTFDFDMNAAIRFDGRGYGNGYGSGYGYGDGYGYNAHVPYYGAPYGFLPPPAPVAAAE
jgi:hypothetical protein